MENPNVINLVDHINQRKEAMEEEVKNDTPFAESSAELIAEFLFFCRKKNPTLHRFCDILTDELKDGAEDALLEMVDRIKDNIALRVRAKNKPEVASLPRRKRTRAKKKRKRVRR